jgi:hydrogenase maturation factor HypF (carbamoyltransferase family)
MFRNAGTVKEHCIVSEKEREVLESWRKPVVLLAEVQIPHCKVPAK